MSARLAARSTDRVATEPVYSSPFNLAAAQGVPLAQIAIPLSGIVALLGGLSIALGYRARLGAWLIVLFLVPVTLAMHRFWGPSDPQFALLQQAIFMKNLSLLGAALLLPQVGSGPLSPRKD